MDKCLSVGIPVYNVEPYLEQCLQSVCDQTYRNLEILVINDGSTDNSGTICEQFAVRDKRIRYLKTENQGAAKARERAALLATGEFMMFVDADDSVSPDFFQNIMEQNRGYDLITAGYQREYCGVLSQPQFDRIPAGLYVTEEERVFLLSNMLAFQLKTRTGMTPYLWNKCFRTSLVKEVFAGMKERISVGEDLDFLCRYLLKCESVFVTRLCGYYYHNRADSALHRCQETYLKDIAILYDELTKVFRRHRLAAQLCEQLQVYTTHQLLKAPELMGFCEEAKAIHYIFPFPNLVEHQKIVLYGAGRVGRDYYRQLKHMGCDSMKWCDAAWEGCREQGYPVDAPDSIRADETDWLILAMRDSETAESARQSLQDEFGIPDEKMLWKEPYTVLAG